MHKFNTKGSRFSILWRRDADIHHNKSKNFRISILKMLREFFFSFIVVLANFLNPLHKEQNKSKAYKCFSTDKSHGCKV